MIPNGVTAVILQKSVALGQTSPNWLKLNPYFSSDNIMTSKFNSARKGTKSTVPGTVEFTGHIIVYWEAYMSDVHVSYLYAAHARCVQHVRKTQCTTYMCLHYDTCSAYTCTAVCLSHSYVTY